MAESVVRDLRDRHVIHLNKMSGFKNPWLFQYGEPGYVAVKNTNLLLRSGFRPKISGAVNSLPALLNAFKKLIG